MDTPPPRSRVGVAVVLLIVVGLQLLSSTSSYLPLPSLGFARSSLLPPNTKYLLLLNGLEGFGAWSDSIMETLLLAKSLNRTWVEPCIRNGCLEPCRCDALPDMPTEYDPAATPDPASRSAATAAC